MYKNSIVVLSSYPDGCRCPARLGPSRVLYSLLIPYPILSLLLFPLSSYPFPLLSLIHQFPIIKSITIGIMQARPFKPPHRGKPTRPAQVDPNRPRKGTGTIDQRLIEGARVPSPLFERFRVRSAVDGDAGVHQEPGYKQRRIGDPLSYPGLSGGHGDIKDINQNEDKDEELDEFGEFTPFYLVLFILGLMGRSGVAGAE